MHCCLGFFVEFYELFSVWRCAVHSCRSSDATCLLMIEVIRQLTQAYKMVNTTKSTVASRKHIAQTLGFIQTEKYLQNNTSTYNK